MWCKSLIIVCFECWCVWKYKVIFCIFTFLYWIILDLDYRVAKIPEIVSYIPLTQLLLMLILYIDITMAHVSKLRHRQWCSTSRVHVCMLSHFRHVWLCNPMDCSLPASSMRFSRQEYWKGLSCPVRGDLPAPGIEPVSCVSPADRCIELPLQGSHCVTVPVRPVSVYYVCSSPLAKYDGKKQLPGFHLWCL